MEKLPDIKRNIRCNNCGKLIRKREVGSCCDVKCQKEFDTKTIYGCLKNEQYR